MSPNNRVVPWALALLAFLLTLPALRAGLIGDDYFHRMVLLGIEETGYPMSPLRDLFAFVPKALTPFMIEGGYLPWWSDPEIEIALGRPLTALTHVADYVVWPDGFALQHFHSLLWLAAGVFLVALVYRRVHGATLLAAVAAALFAVEDAHTWPAGWLANRNALICLVAGAGVILLHVAWCRRRRAWRLALALAVLAIGLGCGEATLGALAYVAAWQLTEQPGSWWRRLAPLVPYAAVMVAWRVVYDWMGYGTHGSTLYVDPATHPLQFLSALTERWPVLMLGQWLQAPINLWLFLPRAGQLALWAVATAVTMGVAWLLFGLLRRERLARFWALGMSLSLMPLCAAFPMDRLLAFPGIGAFGLLAMLLESTGVWPWAAVGEPSWRRRAAWLLLVLHGLLAPPLLLVRTALLPVFGKTFSVVARQGPVEPAVTEQTFVFVNGNDLSIVYGHLIRQVEGVAPPPRRMAQLACMTTPNTVSREDAQTLVITSRGGFLARSSDRLFASPTRTFEPGERIQRSDFVAEIRSVTSDQRPREVAFRFRTPLEDPSLRWLYWKDGELLEFPLPEIGERVLVRDSSPTRY